MAKSSAPKSNGFSRRRAPVEGAGGGPRRRRADRSSPSPAKRIYSICNINIQLDGCQLAKGRQPVIKTTSAGYGSGRSRRVTKQGGRRRSAIGSEPSRRG